MTTTHRSRILLPAFLGAMMSCTSTCGPSPEPPASSTGVVVVKFPGADAAERPLVLYSGMRGGTCRAFEAHVGSPSVTLSGVSYDPACPAEIDVFAAEHAAVAMATHPLQPGSDAWILQAIATGTLTIALVPPTPVPMKLWLVANASGLTSATSMRDRLLDKAFPIVETLGPGLSLDTASKVLAVGALGALGAHCDNAGVISTNSGIYDASRLNVYFVEDYANIDDLTPAMNCVYRGHPEIMFVSWGNSNVVDPTLAHELAHALGLIHPKSDWGHTYWTSGFDAGNLMYQGADVTNASIGQLYAMNFSSDSWLNADASLLRRPVVRTCQDTWGTGPCPALTMFQVGWPP